MFRSIPMDLSVVQKKKKKLVKMIGFCFVRGQEYWETGLGYYTH